MSKNRHRIVLTLLFVLSVCAAALMTCVSTQAQNVTGSGTTGKLPKFTGTSSIGNSIIIESSGKIGINIPVPQRELHVGGTIRVDRSSNAATFMLHRTGLKTFFLGVNASATNNGEFFISDLGSATTGAGTRRMTINNTGNVGIGIDIPASKLAVAGTIQSTSGGFKFPDGTVQTTAATGGGGGLSSVSHNSTLSGNGTAASPLSVASPLFLTGAPGFGAAVLNGGSTGSGIGVRGTTASTGFLDAGVAGTATASSGGVVGVIGRSVSSSSGIGVRGLGSQAGGYFEAAGVAGNFDGVVGVGGSSTGYGVWGQNSSGGFAGNFDGDVNVAGTLSKSAGSFKIDHPLDPEHKYLWHSFVESPDMKNIYDGNVTTDANGDAAVSLPEWFEALNQDFRYQLTVIGQFAQAIVSSEIAGNHFNIKTDKPNVKVSWQVTGIRHDAYAEAHRIPVEEAKPEKEQGSYLHPDLFRQPEEKGVQWALRPQMMQRIKDDRLRRGDAQPKVAPPQQ